VTLSGVVSDVEWANPHIYIHVDVKDAKGAITTWRLESVPVAMMRKAGLSKVLLLGNGQLANIEAYLARDGTPHLGYLVNVTYADGHHYQFASDK
jgi:prepilin-type processing-associated H-X9-DG protein